MMMGVMRRHLRRAPGVAAMALAAALGLQCGDGSPAAPVPEQEPPPEVAAAPFVGCTLPPGTWNENCRRLETPQFLAQVDEAIDRVAAQSPEMFDFNRVPRGGCHRCYLVHDPDRFTAELVATMETMGFCAFYDGEELGVKNTNEFNEQYDVLTFEFYLRREEGSYRSTCWPAWF